MSSALSSSGKNTFDRGIHPPGHKSLAANSPIEVFLTPKKVFIALSQHTGAPNEAAHKPMTPVALGDVVGKSDAFVSAPVHASVAGKTSMAAVATLPNGRHVRCVPITAAGDQLEGAALFDDVLGGDWPLDNLSQYEPAMIAKAVREAGLVGLGGAAFPTHVKFAIKEEKPIDTILINGCECEPYLTADERVMLEAPAPVIAGSVLSKIAAKAKRVVICVEDNKAGAIEALRSKVAGTGVEVKALHTKYPQGGEKQLIPAALGRVVPTGGLPLDVGVVVINVGTAAAIARAVMRGKPLTHRVVSVTGAGIKTPKNLLLPVGVTYREVIDYCGGLTEDAARIVAGGPMMGFTAGSLGAPVTKGTSGVTVLTHRDVAAADETSCVRCGRCADVCPLNLVPTKIALASRHRDWDLAKKYHIQVCMECGCCAYVCPASLPLVQLMRMGKALLPK